MRPFARWYRIIRRRGHGHGSCPTGRGLSPEDVGEGGISLVARGLAISALVVLIISHIVVLSWT